MCFRFKFGLRSEVYRLALGRFFGREYSIKADKKSITQVFGITFRSYTAESSYQSFVLLVYKIIVLFFTKEKHSRQLYGL